nr:alpha/beta fold hydrolase [Sphingomonas oleivorans]
MHHTKLERPLEKTGDTGPRQNLLEHLSEEADRHFHAMLARSTAGISPAALTEAFMDWAVHLTISPSRRAFLLAKAVSKVVRLWNYALRYMADSRTEPCIEPLPQDRRFCDPAWQGWPYNFIHQMFLLNQQWWHNAMTGVDGVTSQHEKVVDFIIRQMLDTASPSNFPLTNPVVGQRIAETRGECLIDGSRNFLDDLKRLTEGLKPAGTEEFQLGRNVAATPGQVVYRNRLIELIQYSPATDTVRPEPVLLVPAWIMKYYILDLSPENSLVRYLIRRGYTVFMISWHNPGAEDRDLCLDDYRRLGITAALDAIGVIMPQAKVHATGYCLGGTLLSIVAAEMARDKDERLRSMTLLAAQTDFTEAGELALFINHSEVHFLEDLMWDQGYLDTSQMSGAFQLLRSKDLIWSRMVRDYLMGQRAPMTDIMAWNADTTRMPYRMHSEYLRQLFLNDDLASGRFMVDGRPIALTDIRVPIFAVGTEWDHVAPWRSVFKIHLLTDTDVTFALTTGGHNKGIVAPPDDMSRSYRMLSRRAYDHHLDPDNWLTAADDRTGSWWHGWASWLDRHSGAMTTTPDMGAPDKGYMPIADAPGTYVLEA